MKTKNSLVISFCLIISVTLGCSFIDNIRSKIQPTNELSQKGDEGQEVATLIPETGETQPQNDSNLPTGGCPENLNKIVYSYDPMDGTNVREGIYIMNPDGSNQTRLSGTDEVNQNQPAWSPERCRIAFTSHTEDGDDDIFVMTADGKSVQRLTTDSARDMFPDWSPDGQQIVFVSYRNGGIRNLFVMNSDGSDQRQLTDNPEEYSQWEQWAPVGEEIAYIYHPKPDDPQGGRIFIINQDGSGSRQLTPDEGTVGETDLTWSPDGKKIYFVSNRSHQNEIWEINIDGSGMRQISQLEVSITHSLRVSPDGEWLAFYGVGSDVGTYSQEIYVINVDGSGLKAITLSPGSEEWLDW
jgi:TolB protein